MLRRKNRYVPTLRIFKVETAWKVRRMKLGQNMSPYSFVRNLYMRRDTSPTPFRSYVVNGISRIRSHSISKVLSIRMILSPKLGLKMNPNSERKIWPKCVGTFFGQITSSYNASYTKIQHPTQSTVRCASFTAPHRTCTVYRQTHTLYSCPMTIRCEAINWCLNSLAYFEWIEFISVTDRRTAYIFHSSTLLSIGPNGNFFIENTACSDSAWFASLRYNLCRRHNGTLHKLEWLLFCLLAAKKTVFVRA